MGRGLSRGNGSPVFDCRTLLLGAVPVVLIAGALGLWLVLVAGRLPHPVASHWSGSGPADGFMGVAGMAWTAVGAVLGTGLACATCLSLNSLGSGIRRGGVAGTVLLTGAIASMMVAGLAPQLDRPSAVGTLMNWGLVGPCVGIAAVLAAVAAWLVPARPLESCDAGIPRHAPVDSTGAARGDSLACSIRASTWLYRVVVALLLLSGGLLAPASAWWLLGAAALTALVLAFFSALVTASADGLCVRVLGRWRLVRVPVASYSSVQAVRKIEPLRYGGWGYRVGSWGTAFVVRRGPGLVLTVAGGREFVVNTDTAETAETMAALLNGYTQLSSRHPAAGGRNA